MMPRALYLSCHVPSENASQAGHKTAWRNLARLADTHRVDVVLVANATERGALPKAWPSNVTLSAQIYLPLWWMYALILVNLVQFSPPFGCRYAKAARDAIRGLVTSNRYDRIWIEFTEGLAFLDDLPGDVPITLNIHDVLVQWALRGRRVARTFAAAIYRDEARMLPRVERVLAPSEKDQQLLESLYALRWVEHDPPPLSEFLRLLRRTDESVQRNLILFWGALGRRENSDAILQFMAQHWARIRAAVPDVKLCIVGSNPPPAVLRLADSDIEVTGFVEDPSPYFERAEISIAPLLEGAGVKLKVLEALHAGLPVFATPLAAEGIPAQPALVVVPFENMDDAIIERLAHGPRK